MEKQRERSTHQKVRTKKNLGFLILKKNKSDAKKKKKGMECSKLFQTKEGRQQVKELILQTIGNFPTGMQQ